MMRYGKCGRISKIGRNDLSMHRLLIVEDDKTYLNRFVDYFASRYEILSYGSEDEFWYEFLPYSQDVVLLDIRLRKDREGLALLKGIKDENPFLPVIMITGYDDVDFYMEALTLKADAYLSKKNFNFPAIGKVIETLLSKSVLEKKVSNLEKQLTRTDRTEIIGPSPQIEDVKEKVLLAAADSQIIVLVRGETGVGKELVARNIHALGLRKAGPFVPVMIAGMPRDIMYSSLFGHEKGSFTGAHEKRRGFIEEAHQGVLFFDEIGDLDLESQIKLLRVIENRSFTRLGGIKDIHVDVQFIFATHQDLEKMVASERFRKDLYFRMKALEIIVPPLRERKEDIAPLAEYFVQLLRKDGRTYAEKISREIMKVFEGYSWPGNVRELKNIVETLGTYSQFKKKSVIGAEFLGILGGIIGDSQSPILLDAKEWDYLSNLASCELNLVEESIKKYGERKAVLYKKLGYPSRYTFLRRIKKLLSRFPEKSRRFPSVVNLFSRGDEER